MKFNRFNALLLIYLAWLHSYVCTSWGLEFIRKKEYNLVLNNKKVLLNKLITVIKQVGNMQLFKVKVQKTCNEVTKSSERKKKVSFTFLVWERVKRERYNFLRLGKQLFPFRPRWWIVICFRAKRNQFPRQPGLKEQKLELSLESLYM